MLVYWPEEDCVSIVAGLRVSGGRQVHSVCTVFIQKRQYSGQVAATGKCTATSTNLFRYSYL